MTVLEIAKQAYDAYARTTDNKNFRGNEMPKFDDLPLPIKQAWCSASSTVLHTTKQYKTKKAADSFKELADSFKDFLEILSDRVNYLNKEITKETNTQNRSFVEGLKEAHLSDLSEIKYILRSATNTNERNCTFDIPPIIDRDFVKEEIAKDTQKKEDEAFLKLVDLGIKVGDKVKVTVNGDQLTDIGVNRERAGDIGKVLVIASGIDSDNWGNTLYSGYIKVRFDNKDLNFPYSAYQQFISVIE